jgi:hypothetical protein
MPHRTSIKGNVDAANNQLAPFRQPVKVVADADP